VYSAGSIPENVAEMGESDKSSFLHNNRSREVSGMQTEKMFAGTFMSHQGSQDSVEIDVGASSCQINDTRGYDMGGCANLDAVLQTNVPEPFALNDDENNLKPEGVPEGMSDHVAARGDRLGSLNPDLRLYFWHTAGW